MRALPAHDALREGRSRGFHGFECTANYIGGDRYHWTVDGPAGVPVEWDSELLNVAENREMTWRSVEGADVDNTGRVRFQAERDGTRIDVQMRYMASRYLATVRRATWMPCWARMSEMR